MYSGIHHLAIVHDDRRPVGILVERQTTQGTVFRIIKHHITDLIIPIYTRNTVVTDIGYSNDLSRRQPGRIKELKVFLG